MMLLMLQYSHKRKILVKKSKTSPQKSSYAVSTNFQKAFSAVLIGTFAAQSGWFFWNWYDQLSFNPETNGWVWWLTQSILVPVAVFLAAWALRPKQATKLAKLFDSLLVSTAAIPVYFLVNLVATELFVRTIAESGNEGFDQYQMVSTGVFFVAYLAMLLYLRTARKWR